MIILEVVEVGLKERQFSSNLRRDDEVVVDQDQVLE